MSLDTRTGEEVEPEVMDEMPLITRECECGERMVEVRTGFVCYVCGREIRIVEGRMSVPDLDWFIHNYDKGRYL